MEEHQIASNNDFEAWRKEELAFLRDAQAGVAPERTQLEMRYVRLLKQLDAARYVLALILTGLRLLQVHHHAAKSTLPSGTLASSR